MATSKSSKKKIVRRRTTKRRVAKKRTAKRRTTKRRSTKRRTSAKRKTAKRRASKKKTSTKKRRVSKKKTTVKRRRKARKSVRGTRSQVFRGTRLTVKTTGQKKSDLMKNKRGKVVSKIANKAGKATYKRNGLDKWNKAFMQARKNLGLEGFVSIKKGTPFYEETMKLYKN